MLAITGLNDARKRDSQDPLARYRPRFFNPDPSLIYLDGNSLGKLTLQTRDKLIKTIEHDWGTRLIRSWNEGWLELPHRIGDKIAKITGASPGEVIIADSTSINLFKLMTAALRYQSPRTKIITCDLNFPSDIYIMQGVLELLPRQYELVIVPSEDGIYGPETDIMKQLDEQTALVSLSHTVFKSGYTYDMEKITHMAHEVGALVLWDLSHSVGAIDIELNRCQADLAVGCTYKYLNGGPGAPAFLYVNQNLVSKLSNPVSGWMGQQNMFEFSLENNPAAGISQFMTGTPPVLSLIAIEEGVDMILEAGIQAIREKSLAQTDYLISLWKQLLSPLGVKLKTPEEYLYRGSHVSLGHPEGLGIDLAMIHERHIVPDFRSPDNIRLGIAPLYTSYEDIFRTVIAMKEIIENKSYLRYQDNLPSVT